jgi:hypothetical protein
VLGQIAVLKRRGLNVRLALLRAAYMSPSVTRRVEVSSYRELVGYGRDRGEPLRPILTTIAVAGDFCDLLTPGSSESEARGVAGGCRSPEVT